MNTRNHNLPSSSNNVSQLDEIPQIGDIATNSLNSVSADGAGDVFSCQYCPKSFNRRENLSRHLKTHDSSKSHCCSKCGKGFTRSDLLKRHEAGHERWDREDANGKPTMAVKRRKVAFKNSESNASKHLPPLWQPPSVQQARTSQPSYHLDAAGREMLSPFGEPYSQNDLVPDYQTLHHTNQSYSPSSQGQENVYSDHQVPNEELAQFNLNRMDSIVPFDFSSFLLPTNVGPPGNEWFSYDFYSAMRETGHEWGNLGVGYEPNISTPGQDYGDVTEMSSEKASGREEPSLEIPSRHLSQGKALQELSDAEDDGSVTRVSSPPNEASEEDKWPFQWNPNSRPVLKAHAITIADNHPLFANSDARFDITETSLLRLKSFLHPPSGREFHQSQKGSFILPPLPTINLFIRLFFEKFSPQMPVLHHATVNTNTDLPPPLLAAIIIIGAIYSHIKHTRRFAIVLLDLVRWHLRIALECDNSLMRDPHIIYAEALICHTGLWCGNKRAFELAEVVRGALVTYIRRLRFGDQLSQKQSASPGSSTSNVQIQWKSWIAEESQRRLAWVIYSIDSQFPSILNLPPSISIGEVRNVGCPCDEEFWCASSARNWKNLLGPASVPPSRSFSAAVGPFLLNTSMLGADMLNSSTGRLPVLNLNTWSAFLVLISITHQIFQASQDSMIAHTFDDDSDDSTPVDEPIKGLRQMQILRRDQLADALNSWSLHYLHHSRSHIHATSLHFHASSVVLHSLSTIVLEVSLSDLQGAIGKDGATGIASSLSSLTSWAGRNPLRAEQVALNAVKTIILLAPRRVVKAGDGIEKPRQGGIGDTDTAQYGIITIFLCHVVLWVFSSVSSVDMKQRLLAVLASDGEVRESWFLNIMKGSLGLSRVHGSAGNDAPRILFRSAAEMLTRQGTWGASLNLALLLHQRSEM